MEWTKEKPKQEGWHWWRSPADHGVVRVYEAYGDLCYDLPYGDREEVKHSPDVEWFGPVEPPK
jgi:hypothetical protein